MKYKAVYDVLNERRQATPVSVTMTAAAGVLTPDLHDHAVPFMDYC